MTKANARKLRPGDQVYWNDPDNDACSRYYTIATIEVDMHSGMVKISEKDGSYLECWARELS